MMRSLWTRRKWWLISAAVVALLIGCPFCWFLTSYYRYHAEIARIRAAGEPVLFTEIGSIYPKPPSEQDSTELWLKAYAMFDAPSFVDDVSRPSLLFFPEQIPSLDQDWPEQAAVERFLETHREVLCTIHQAALKGGRPCIPNARRFEFEFAERPHRGAYLAWGLLEAQAAIAIRGGDRESTLTAIRSLRAVSRLIAVNPTPVEWFADLSLDCLGIEELQSALAVLDFTGTQLKRLQENLSTDSYQEELRKQLLAFRAWMIQVADTKEAQEIVYGQLAWTRPKNYGDLRVCLEYFRQYIESCELPWPELVARVRTIDATLKVDEPSTMPTELTEFFRPFRFIILPHISLTIERSLSMTRRTQNAFVGLAVARFRKRHGRLPERLEELVPEFLAEPPTDPVTGRPLQYWVGVGESERRGFAVGGPESDDRTLVDPFEPSHDERFQVLYR